MNNKPILLAGSIALITVISCNANAKDWKDMLNAVKEQANGQSLNSAAQLQANPQVKNAAEELKSGSLTDLLMQRVGVTQTQAEGGAGALFQVAKGKMQADSFSQLEQSVPGIQSSSSYCDSDFFTWRFSRWIVFIGWQLGRNYRKFTCCSLSFSTARNVASDDSAICSNNDRVCQKQ